MVMDLCQDSRLKRSIKPTKVRRAAMLTRKRATQMTRRVKKGVEVTRLLLPHFIVDGPNHKTKRNRTAYMGNQGRQ